MLAKLTILNHTSIPVSARALDAASLRGKAIADNFANVVTPGYQRIEVEFEDRLKHALAVEDANGQEIGRPELEKARPMAYRSEDPTFPGEVNNVDVDLEAAKLAETQIMYNFGVRFIRERLETLQSAGKSF